MLGRARGADAAGTLSVGFWDHWVPGANDYLTRLCHEWAAKEKVDIQIDYITSQGNKDLLTIEAESQARSGHDLLAFRTWEAISPRRAARAGRRRDEGDHRPERQGQPRRRVPGAQDGRWIAVPATPGSQIKGPCSRIDLMKQHAGIDVVAMYPADGPTDQELAKAWTLDTFLAAAEKCAKAGYPFGIGLGTTADSVDTAGAIFHAFGAQLVDEKGEITVRSDATLQALDYMKRLAAFLPPDVIAWDDASNNRWLISGKGALIFNPPSAWAVAKRDAPRSPSSAGPTRCPPGPRGGSPLRRRSTGASGASRRTSRRPRACWPTCRPRTRSGSSSRAARATTSRPTRPSTISRPGPRRGRPRARCATIPWFPASRSTRSPAPPAPPRIGIQIYNQATMTKMVARMVQGGETAEKAVAWAESELEGFLRT